MSPRDWFATVLRFVGVLKIVESIDDCVSAYDISAGLYTPQSTTLAGTMNHAMVMGLVGFVLLVAAPFLAGLLVSQPQAQVP